MHSISIIIPVYNPPENQLRACLDSVLDQEGVILDIIAVNDGSTNSAPQVINEYKEKHPDIITVINQENQSHGIARNNGYKYAKGEYVWFVDSDDQVRPNCMKSLIDAMVEHDAEHLLFNFERCDAIYFKKPFPPLSNEPIIEVPKEYNFYKHYASVSRRILKKTLLDRVGVSFISAYGEDQAESIKITIESNKVLLAQNCYYRVMITPNSLCYRRFHSPELLQTTISVVDIFLDEAKKYPQYKQWINLYAYIFIKENIERINKSRKLKEARIGDTMQQFKQIEEELKKRNSFSIEDRLLIDIWGNVEQYEQSLSWKVTKPLRSILLFILKNILREA